MRGKACLKRPSGPGLRITPAYAGKSAGMACNGQIRQDHPRVCGEKVDGGRNRSRQMGSPPRMRGKACVACASAAPGWDHPRVCGEKNLEDKSLHPVRGSPPRMRGKEETETGGPGPSGITPAYAGKRSSCVSVFAGFRDHPRVCGEKLVCLPFRNYTAGSPPRMRGKVDEVLPGDTFSGITPAYAGKS